MKNNILATISLTAGALLSIGAAYAETKPAAPAAAPSLAPITQAKTAGLTTCSSMLKDLATVTIDADHVSNSAWSAKDPNKHLFSSDISLTNKNNVNSPRTFAQIVVTPTPENKCEGSNVRVAPTKSSCDEVAVTISKLPDVAKGEPLGGLANLTLKKTGQRVFLMPTPTTGCVVITTGAYFAPK